MVMSVLKPRNAHENLQTAAQVSRPTKVYVSVAFFQKGLVKMMRVLCRAAVL